MSDDIKNKVIEALQELVYDLERQGDLLAAEEIRESLAIVKGMTPEQIRRCLQNQEMARYIQNV